VSLSNHGNQLASAAGQRLVFGRPRGLVFIAATELLDRISIRGMRVLLMLYMVEQLLLSGHIQRIAGFAQLPSEG
jgi:POT family proton-dependent oligopeptide transporter